MVVFVILSFSCRFYGNEMQKRYIESNYYYILTITESK
jgi:hypothetical protein